MATQFITTDPGGTVFLDDGDEAFVVQGVNVTSLSDAFVISPDNGNVRGEFEITVAGNVYADDDFLRATFDSSTADDAARVFLSVAAGGSIIVGADLFSLTATDPDFSEKELAVNNAGFISVAGAAVIAPGFESIEFINSGVLTQSATFGTGDDQDLFDNLGEGDTKIVNHGLIQTAQDSNVLSDVLEIGSTLEVVNTGIIDSSNPIAFFVGGSGDMFSFNNSGTVVGNVVSLTTMNFVNSGTQNGTVAGGSRDDTVSNTGSINGNVLVGTGEDEVLNSGSINGDVELGLGDDFFKMLGNGLVSGEIKGDPGNDTIIGGAFDDLIDGGSDDDLLRGKNGDDDLIGFSGNDTVFGGNGNDTLTGDGGNDDLRGGAGNDSITGDNDDDELRGGTGDDTLLGGGNKDLLLGGTGNDSMEGGIGNDTLRGGTGDDTIAGQNGSDQLSGGAGADVFLFTNTNHSPLGNRDDILDFQKGQDKIDIDGLSNDTFVFLGNGAFTASGDAEVRVTSNGAGNSVVRIDTDGDGLADSEIDVLGVTGLEAGDFIL